MVFDISLLSFALKMGAKRVSKGILKNFLKTQIEVNLSKIAIKSHAKRHKKTLLCLQSSLEETWHNEKTIPILNQSFDFRQNNTSPNVQDFIAKADRLAQEVRITLSKQWRYSGKLISASLKTVDDYPFDLENVLTYADVHKPSKRSKKAKKLKKLIEQQERLMEKN